MTLNKKQIEKFLSLVGQPKGSVLLNDFFKRYCNYLNSSDVSKLYDKQYSLNILNHPVHKKIDNKYSINIYTKYSYEYIVKNNMENKIILDIGCGSGDFAHALSFHGAKVVGIDFNSFFIDQANKVAKENNLDCTFYCEDINNKEFDFTFDYIVLNDVTEHLSDVELDKLFSSIYNLLSEDGQIIIHTPNGLALCNETDSSFIQKLYTYYLKFFKNYQGFERSTEQIYYDQVHINIKSFKQLKSFLSKYKFSSNVFYDNKRFGINFLDEVFSSNYLAIFKK